MVRRRADVGGYARPSCLTLTSMPVSTLVPTLVFALAFLLLTAPSAWAQSSGQTSVVLEPNADLANLMGKPITKIEIVTLGDRWAPKKGLSRVRVGQIFHPQLAREALQELAATGQFAELRSEVDLAPGGVTLRLIVLPRRLITQLKILGGALPEDATLRAASLAREQAITVFDSEVIATRVTGYYQSRGYAAARASVEFVDTDQPMQVVVLIHLEPDVRQKIEQVSFEVSPIPSDAVSQVLREHAVAPGDPVDEEALAAADAQTLGLFKSKGWNSAQISHRVLPNQDLVVQVKPGSQVRLRFEGNRTFDDGELLAALELSKTDDRSDNALIDKLHNFYVARGFLDAQIAVRHQGSAGAPLIDQVFVIRELTPVHVTGRVYPCLSGPRTANDVDAEIDGVLSGVLPGLGLIGPPKTGADQKARRLPVQEQEAWATYDVDAYSRAIKHVQELYRSEGYLSATVGPVVLLRRQCDSRFGPSDCRPVGQSAQTAQACQATERGDPLPATLSCTYDAKQGRLCESNVVLQIPIALGPQTTLYDLKFEGNKSLLESQLKDLSELELGEPTSYLDLQKAQQRISEAYANEGFAFATVEGEFQLSEDRTRALAHFVISESEQVRVRDIVVQGAERTREEVILRRARFAPGDIFRRDDGRRTEELLATLGVFSSASVTLRDPEVPAREKTVIISVHERESQYLEVRPGVSTGEGVRLTLEYGHRNLGGSAIQLRLRSQLGFLPDVLILESQVRRKYSELPISRRLERRNTASVEFPEIGLGPLFRFAVEAVDVRDNSRDYGITKDAVILTVSYQPGVAFTAALRGSLELNNAEIFGNSEKNALETYLRQNNSALLQRLLNVPQGQTLAVAQRGSVLWDKRDNPFGATRGTLLSFSAEHVDAVSLEKNLDLTSQFMHYTGRVAGYLRLSDAGMAFAASFGFGYNQQLQDGSQTYPDRFFFLGGADSLRGFLQASLVPQDVAKNILDPNNPVTINEVTIRGGDIMINPRAELRIPLTATWQTAVFVDTGNLWLDARQIDPTVLRYAAGSGLRAATPIGPLALDYGINLNRRPWEDFGAFHFSIGLF